jgi:hypothetical protein
VCHAVPGLAKQRVEKSGISPDHARNPLKLLGASHGTRLALMSGAVSRPFGGEGRGGEDERWQRID